MYTRTIFQNYVCRQWTSYWHRQKTSNPILLIFIPELWYVVGYNLWKFEVDRSNSFRFMTINAYQRYSRKFRKIRFPLDNELHTGTNNKLLILSLWFFHQCFLIWMSVTREIFMYIGLIHFDLWQKMHTKTLGGDFSKLCFLYINVLSTFLCTDQL